MSDRGLRLTHSRAPRRRCCIGRHSTFCIIHTHFPPFAIQMQPHASSSSAESPSLALRGDHGAGLKSTIEDITSSPVEAKPLPTLPSLRTVSPPRSGSPTSYSPSVKRKPLPSNALSPPQQSHNPPVSDPEQRIRSVAPSSSNTLNEIINSEPHE